jgi:hypothetical protein
MDVNVSACREGYLLSADCMAVPQRATDLYWPVSAVLGIIDCRELPDEACERILADIDARQYSFVGTPEALRLRIPILASLRPYEATGNPNPRRGNT